MKPLLVCVGVALAGLTACSPPEPPARPALPPRPFTVDVAGLDPCTMFSADQRTALGLRKASPRQATVDGTPSPGCVWLGTTDIGYNTQTIRVGAEVALPVPGTTLVQVRGFGAVRNVVREMTGGAPTCQVTIDAAAGASIRVQAQSSRPDRDDGEMCRFATDAASLVMTTVAARPG